MVKLNPPTARDVTLVGSRFCQLIAAASPTALPRADLREPARVLLPSLALGGAERIVLDWLAAEAALGRAVELAVLHERRVARPLPKNLGVRVRGDQSVTSFVRSIGASWHASRAPVSTHLIADDVLALLWAAGVQTVPVVHNVKAGWRNDPASWSAEHVPLAIACADAVRDEMLAHDCRVPVVTIRHRPKVADQAFDSTVRTAARAELGVGPDTLLVLAVGALKPQKHYSRAIQILRHLRERRDAALVIVGGALDATGLAELDVLVDAAMAAGVVDHLKLPGFAHPIEPYYAAADVLLNVSRFEGLSMATQEAIDAGLPVVATKVGGQNELAHANVQLVSATCSDAVIADFVAAHPVRTTLARNDRIRLPRLWSMSFSARRRGAASVDTLFVTANLNAGGAQRSLVNLASAIAGRHAFAIAVCNGATHEEFPRQLRRAQIELFLPASMRDALAQSESLLAHVQARGVRNLCLWNVDPKIKLLLARFAPSGLRLFDVSPGAYAFAELDAQAEFAAVVGMSIADYYRRLDVLVLKYHALSYPPCARVEVIPNGVAQRERCVEPPPSPRFLVNGRIARSKQLEIVLDAFERVWRMRPDAELHIVGQAETRDADYAATLTARAAGMPVFFCGAQPELQFLQKPFSAAIVLGTNQGSPNAVLEAMSAAIPVIANDSGGTRELFETGVSGWLLPEHCTAVDLAVAMLKALRYPSLGPAAQERVRQNHSLEAMGQRYLALFNEPACS